MALVLQTVPAGIYGNFYLTLLCFCPISTGYVSFELMKLIYVIAAKVHYGTSLSNVDWLHGGAESLLTLTNLFIVLGLRNALRKIKNEKKIASEVVSEVQEQQTSV